MVSRIFAKRFYNVIENLPATFVKPLYNIPRGWLGGAMMLGKLPVPGRPTVWITVGQGPTALAVGAGGGCLDIFTLICPFFPLSPSLWETARYRPKYCLKGPLNPKQPTNQLYNIPASSVQPSCNLGGGRVVRWCWVNFQCRGILQFGYSRARAYCARSRCGWGLYGHFYFLLSFFSLSLGDGSI